MRKMGWWVLRRKTSGQGFVNPPFILLTSRDFVAVVLAAGSELTVCLLLFCKANTWDQTLRVRLLWPSVDSGNDHSFHQSFLAGKLQSPGDSTQSPW